MSNSLKSIIALLQIMVRNQYKLYIIGVFDHDLGVGIQLLLSILVTI